MASEVWSENSGSYPLSINIVSHSHNLPLPEIYPALFLHRARWEYLTLNVYTPSVLVIDGPVPLLRHLDLTQHSNSNFELRDAPQLRSVVLCHSWAATLPWQQLTQLTIEQTVLGECLPVLRQTTNLVYCDVTVWSVGHNDPDDGFITLPFLESLVFNMNPENLGSRILNLLTVPALRRLEIRERCIEMDPIGYLTSFIAKSHCRLRILEIVSRRTVHRNAYRLAFPSIPKFAFDNSYFEPASDEEASEEDSEGDEDEDEDNSESAEDFSVDGDSGSSDGQIGSDAD
ncbi:YDG domain-containing protein [Mycena sanguinolenta]|uniref:YDG domain-containing protein n=1 Tax=Mycena sanguinolenta TaxID=230812 RepID=A0A8H7DIC4_9AGAR|nr:YDG domain-containing protein [Mycena sanguinolenta]